DGEEAEEDHDEATEARRGSRRGGRGGLRFLRLGELFGFGRLLGFGRFLRPGLFFVRARNLLRGVGIPAHGVANGPVNIRICQRSARRKFSCLLRPRARSRGPFGSSSRDLHTARRELSPASAAT